MDNRASIVKSFLYLCLLLGVTALFYNCTGGSLCQSDQDCFGGTWRCINAGCVKPDGDAGSGGTTDSDLIERRGWEPSKTGPCKPGQKQACYSGPSITRGRGLCKDGTQTCTPNGVWGACLNDTLPVQEICDKKDNDCDGKVDDSCLPTGCKPGTVVNCYGGPANTVGKGICRMGKKVCSSAGFYGNCKGNVLPQKEVCNKIDDNCNGKVDDGITCQGGCNPGDRKACYSAGSKYVNKGICRMGYVVCASNRKWGAKCIGEVVPGKELCYNGKDDDCDGTVDEGYCNCIPGQKIPCYTGPRATRKKGSCQDGAKTCNSKGIYGPCLGQRLPGKEVCNKLDDDCDGKIDDGISCGTSCSPGQKVACFTGPSFSRKKGRCKDGIKTCSSSRTWGSCVGQVLPGNELCNGVDDDCDGYTDESFPQQSKPCKTGRPGICGDGLYSCSKGKLICLGFRQPSFEICNGKDDDCNGKVDDSSAKRTYYRDADGDNYGDPKVTTQACLPPKGYVSNNTDCYDKNKNARPGQFGFFTAHRGDGSFDYNCDGKASTRFSTVGSCNGCTSPVIKQGFDKSVPPCGQTGKWITSCRFDMGKCYPNTAGKVQECR